MPGYVKIPRYLFDSTEWTSMRPFSRVDAQIDLIQSATFFVGRVVKFGKKELVLHRGQLVVTMRDLADRWGWTAPTVCRFLEALRNDDCNNIKILTETDSATRKTIVTICDYDRYADQEIENETTRETKANETNFGTTRETMRETTENYVKCCNNANYDDGFSKNETKCETRNETQNETTPYINNSCKQDNNTHNMVDTKKGGCRGERISPESLRLDAEDLLLWIVKNYPAISTMQEPLTLDQAIRLLNRYEKEDIARTIMAMNNKSVWERNRSVYATFVAFSRYDPSMTAPDAKRKFRYEEICDAIMSGRRKWSDFRFVQLPSGRSYYRLTNA